MLPFYKTFPFMDYYKNEEAFAKDLGMIKDMYPFPNRHVPFLLRDSLVNSHVRC